MANNENILYVVLSVFDAKLRVLTLNILYKNIADTYLAIYEFWQNALKAFHYHSKPLLQERFFQAPLLWHTHICVQYILLLYSRTNIWSSALLSAHTDLHIQVPVFSYHLKEDFSTMFGFAHMREEPYKYIFSEALTMQSTQKSALPWSKHIRRCIAHTTLQILSSYAQQTHTLLPHYQTVRHNRQLA